MGLLMNHLGVDEKMRVVFDAGDSKLEDFEEEHEELMTSSIDIGNLRGKSCHSVPNVLSINSSFTLSSIPPQSR